MNAAVQFIIAALIALGVFTSSSDWDNLSEQEKQEYQQNIVIDEPVGI